jgi:hypothetical protein
MPSYHSQFERNMRSQQPPPQPTPHSQTTSTYSTIPTPTNERIPDSFQNDLVNILAQNNNRRLNSQQTASSNPTHPPSNQQSLTNAFHLLLSNSNNNVFI